MFIVNGKKTNLIGVHGNKQSGKDTLGKHLCSHSENVRIIKFADPVRAGLSAIFGYNSTDYEDGIAKEYVDPVLGFSIRDALKALGHGFRQELNENLWVILAQESLKLQQQNGRDCVFTDVRYENERDFILDNGGIMLYINDYSEIVSSHPSDQQLEILEQDVIIDNKKTTLGDYLDSIDMLIKIIN